MAFSVAVAPAVSRISGSVRFLLSKSIAVHGLHLDIIAWLLDMIAHGKETGREGGACLIAGAGSLGKKPSSYHFLVRSAAGLELLSFQIVDRRQALVIGMHAHEGDAVIQRIEAPVLIAPEAGADIAVVAVDRRDAFAVAHGCRAMVPCLRSGSHRPG